MSYPPTYRVAAGLELSVQLPCGGGSSHTQEEAGSVDGRRKIKLYFAYTAAPLRFELIGSVPDTMWNFDSEQRGQHIGVWSEDVRADSQTLEELGMPRTW